MKPLLSAAAIWKSFGPVEVLRGVDLAVDRGECIALLGASGSGKSTLLRCLNLLEPIDSGSILLQNEEIAGSGRKAHLARRRIGMVFQNFELFQHLSAAENVALAPMKVLGESPAIARDRARHLLAQVHLPEKADAYPDELSGGQQQRVAIARALAMSPELMLYDEPTSALDPETVGEVLQVMQELSRAGMTSIVVTHELGFARRAADRTVFMDAGQILFSAAGDAFFNGPKPERVERFLGQMSLS